MGSERTEQQAQSAYIALGAAVCIELVDHSHHCCDSRVHLQLVDILRDLFDGLMDDGFVLCGYVLIVGSHVLQVKAAVEEALRALDGLVRP